METLVLKVKDVNNTSKRLLLAINNAEVDASILEELFLLLLSRKSKASERDVREIADVLEEAVWERIKREQRW